MNVLFLLVVGVNSESTTVPFPEWQKQVYVAVSKHVSSVPRQVSLFYRAVHLERTVVVTYAPVDSKIPGICAATDCIPNTICREVLNRTSGVIFAACLDPVQYPSTGNEERCKNGQPLWVVNSSGGYSEATCGIVADRTTCPCGYRCVMALNDTLALCCPNPVRRVKNGECPKPAVGGICICTCKSDRDCSDVKKCCRTICGGTSCTPPI